MAGARETSNDPNALPEGTTNVIEVLLQELVETGAPFNVTTLPFCNVPNPDPVITTALPAGAVVVERLVIAGAGAAPEVTETLSICDVAKDEGSCPAFS